ncbi:MAG: cytochrome c3 family protein [Coriobacteriia bacterium]|nr:cytochrome c3 family protein [Coriobacteriia bacterium]
MSDEFNGIDDAAVVGEEEQVETAAEGAEEQAETEEKGKAKKPKKKGNRKKTLLIVGIVLVVCIAAVVTVYLTTHSNPHFCNALCHVPMDPYVESFDNGISVKDEQNDPKNPYPLYLEVVKHKEAGLVCLDCHEPTMSEQISEGLKWVTGDYAVPLRSFILTIKEPTKDNHVSGDAFCLREGCHEATTQQALVGTTAHVSTTRIIHEYPHQVANCSNCHKVHSQSVLVCAACHDDEIKLPEGWARP